MELWFFLRNPKNYLKDKGFVLNKKAQFKIYLVADSLCLLIYSGISIKLLIFEDVDLAVFGLNILCLARTAFGNMICASEITAKIKLKRKDIEHANFSNIDVLNNNYYRVKIEKLKTTLFYTICTWVILCFSNALETAYSLEELKTSPFFSLALCVIYIAKFYTCIIILKVLFNELFNNLIRAYDAKIEPLY